MTQSREKKRLNIHLDRRLHDQFKAATLQGSKMTDVLKKFIENYVRQHLPLSLQTKDRE